MAELNDISDLTDIKVLVDQFYSNVREDELIGPIFVEKIQDRWPIHLDKMYRFWQTILLEEHTYMGRPFPPHMQLPVGPDHFDRWLSLFTSTVDQNFKGKKAEEAKWRAGKMAEMFQIKIAHFRKNNIRPIV